MEKKRENSLKLSKGTTFLKSRLLRLPQINEAWEADFRALPKPMMQNETHYLGLVVVKKGGTLLVQMQVNGAPNANDLATLVAHAMCRPLKGNAHRPNSILVRKNSRWQELFPVLEEIGIKVVVQSDLPGVKAAFQDHLHQIQEARRATITNPTTEQAKVDEMFPAIAQWVRDGHIEIGDQEGLGFVVHALDYGGLVFEDDKPDTLAEAMAALEQGLRKWYKDQGIDLDEK